MTLDDYLLTVFCLVDDQLIALHLDQLRQRGCTPNEPPASWPDVT
jgi:hypothetical protein